MTVADYFYPESSLPTDLITIGFVGCDGTGTTTHAKHTSEYLQSKGLQTQTEWMRFDHRLSLPVLALGRLLGKTPKFEGDDGYSARGHNFEESRFLSELYKQTLKVDQSMFARRTFKSIGDDVDALVFDRFILDALVDLAVATKDFSVLRGSIADDFHSLVPENAVVIGLDCDPDVISERRPDVAPDPHIELRIEAYRDLYKHMDIPTIKTSKPLEEAKTEIKDIIKDRTISERGTV